MDFTYPVNNSIESAVESSSSATTPPSTPQPNNNNNNVVKDKESLKAIAPIVKKDDLFTSFKRTESRKRTLLLQQHDFLHFGSYSSSEHHTSPLKKPVPSRFFGDLTSPIGSSSYSNSSSIKSQHKNHLYQGQQHQKTMGPSLWCSSSFCTGKYQLDVFQTISFYLLPSADQENATPIFWINTWSRKLIGGLETFTATILIKML